ncbi:MAG: hypothetical protein JW936_08255 [Sedimentisphaerales bacterium]|nr:hypothetical protein [Sedimentisphaerales bacterium]
MTEENNAVNNCQVAGPVDEAGKPKIERLGTLDVGLVETSPVVFKNKVYRFEYIRTNYPLNTTGDSYFRFIDHETGAAGPAFAKGYHLGNAYVDGDTVYVTCVPEWGADNLVMFVSDDMETWEQRDVFAQKGMTIFNTSMCKAEGRYVLMYEIREPEELAGHAFTGYFLESDDMKTWRQFPNECNYTKEFYSAPHCLRYLDGWFYNFFLKNVAGIWDQYLVRSRDLQHWQESPLNPVMRAEPADKQIINPNLTAEQCRMIAEAENINNSDIDFCEYEGQLIIDYAWGNQMGIDFVGEARYQGTEAQFLRGWFPQE